MRILSVFLVLSFFYAQAGAHENVKTHREFQLDKEGIQVWKTTIYPNQPLKMHRHDHPRIVIGLKGGVLRKVEDTGEVSDLVFETGQAYWLDEDPPGTLHADLNETCEPVEVMVIEFQKM